MSKDGTNVSRIKKQINGTSVTQIKKENKATDGNNGWVMNKKQPSQPPVACF